MKMDKKEQSDDVILEVTTNEEEKRAFLNGLSDDELEQAVEDAKARRKETTQKYLPAIQSVLFNYKQSAKFIHHIVKHYHPEEINNHDNVSDFVHAISNFYKTIQLLRGPIQVGIISSKIADFNLGIGGQREPAILKWKNGNVFAHQNAEERRRVINAIKYMDNTKTARYRPEDVAKNNGCIGNLTQHRIGSFIRQVSNLHTMEKVVELAEEIDESLGQKFCGLRREYFFRKVKGRTYGKQGHATDAFTTWLRKAGDEWIWKGKSSTSSTKTSKTSKKRALKQCCGSGSGSGSVWIRFIWQDPDPDPFQKTWIRIRVAPFLSYYRLLLKV